MRGASNESLARAEEALAGVSVTEELGTNTVLGAKPERIAEIPKLLARPKPGEVVPGWDGSAGARAAEVLRLALD